MLIFLEKVRVETIFSRLSPVRTEPLELLYLKSILERKGVESLIIDPMFGLESPKRTPDLVILTGYNTAQDRMLKRAQWWKKRTDAKVMASGVHVQLNREIFRQESIDFVFHSQDFNSFSQLISKLENKETLGDLPGVDIKRPDGSWSLGQDILVRSRESTLPSRDFFREHRQGLRYLDRRDLAILKTGRGCPYSCSYCCCKNLNGGVYVRPHFRSMFREMKEIGARNYWIVDDVLLTDKNDARSFVDESEESDFKGNIVGYLRADFVKNHGEILRDLRDAGLAEVIIGFETPDEKELGTYNKTMEKDTGKEAIRLLKESGIQLTALFMVAPQYGLREFWRLFRYTWENSLDMYTISIFTPLPGSDEYPKYEERLVQRNPAKYDFLHLVMPARLPSPVFYSLFSLCHLRLLFSKRAWKVLLGR